MSKKNNSQEKITSNGVKHIAKLARLGLTEKEIEKYQKEFSKILDYVEKLKEIDVAKNALHSSSALHSLCSLAPMRKDEVLNNDEKLIDGYLKVKQVFRI